MKVALIGAGSVRSPLLVRSLGASDLPIETISLYDPSPERVTVLSRVSRRYAPHVSLEICTKPEPAIEGARFVLASLRVGGSEQRARDEEASLALGLLGQETVGPAGFALAVRNLPPMIAYGRQVETLAPEAYLLNYTNPVGIVTEGILRETGARVIGICDTPTELFGASAEALGVPAQECRFDYVGLNHLGWLKEVVHQGKPRLAEILSSEAALERIYPGRLFEPSFLHELGLLPTEYLYYYYRTEDAVRALNGAARARGRYLLELERELLSGLAREADPLPAYERYLDERDSTYFGVETGRERRELQKYEGAGYDKIALAVMRAIHFDTGAIVPVNVRNGRTLPELPPDSVVEAMAALDGRGVHPIPTTLPEPVRALVTQVKDYERRTVAASIDRSPRALVDALAASPLVAGRGLAEAAVASLGLS